MDTPSLSPSTSTATMLTSHKNPIDLTGDDKTLDFSQPRQIKRRRLEPSQDSNSWPTSSSTRSPPVYRTIAPQTLAQTPLADQGSSNTPHNAFNSFTIPHTYPSQPYRPAFAPVAGPSGALTAFTGPPAPLPIQPPSLPKPGNQQQIIDLTDSPSPPPQALAQPSLQQPSSSAPLEDLPPKTPVCIGQLHVTALVLYPVGYLQTRQSTNPGSEEEWAQVRLHYDRNHERPGSEDTINIRTPSFKGANGTTLPGEQFGVVEQKVASALGPMLSKGLIRLDAKVRKGLPNLPILPLQMLVYTPKGNIPVVGDYLHHVGLYLDHPAPGEPRVGNYPYHNPHNPPPGGFNRPGACRPGYGGAGMNNRRWSTPNVNAKSVEVQRSQVDELFKSLKDGGDELPETDPPPEVGTKLYPHQKKALTFLLEREQEITNEEGQYSSLWQPRKNTMTGQPSWFHLVTQKEIFHEPPVCRGAILADDMGLGKTITCVSLIAATLPSARAFAASQLNPVQLPFGSNAADSSLTASHFAGSVWGMPEPSTSNALSAKAKAKEVRAQEQMEVQYARACRIKTKSRATLIICPLSTVANWEDQFREHWNGEVTVLGGGGACPDKSQLSSQAASSSSSSCMTPLESTSLTTFTLPKMLNESNGTSGATVVTKKRNGRSIRVYVYHGNARRPDPAFLANCDVVITTFATLASEFSKQAKSLTVAEEEEEDSSDGEGGQDGIIKLKAKKPAKRKRVTSGPEATSALQSVYWFRVVLDEAHSIKETSTVGCRACCDLMADRRLCLTGTPVQNKLDDMFALIKFLRLEPFDDKNTWTEFIGSPVKYGQPLGIARLQRIMKCITLRRTKESKTNAGDRILSLPPRQDQLLYLKFDEKEQAIYDQFFSESKAEFNELSDKNEVMKNYVGILQKILRLRQICDHWELVKGKGLLAGEQSQGDSSNYEDAVAAINAEGITPARAAVVFAILREAATTQCVECGAELCQPSADAPDCAGSLDGEGSQPAKRGRKPKNATVSRNTSRANSPSGTGSSTTIQLVLTRCQHLFCGCCYKRSVHPGWPKSAMEAIRPCPVCQTGLMPSDAVEVNPNCVPGETPEKKKPRRKVKRVKGSTVAEDFHPSTKINALMGDLVQFSKTNPKSANYDPENVDVQCVDGQGNALDDGVVKSVVFSQWTTMLDKIEEALETANIHYERLDGTMKRDERTRSMEALKHDPSCEVLLVSLKAGGVGLNLTAAQRVYLMDPYWNPAVENQAVDRIHRLGQTKPVTTIKYVIENSIEDRLLAVQKKKTELANMTLGQNFSKADLMQRRMEELSALLG